MSNALIVNGEVLYEPTPLQQLYHEACEPKVLMWGNRGGGKSYCARWDAHMRALAYPGYKYCILRRNFPELEKTHLLDVPGEMHKLGGYFHKTQHIAYYPNGSTGFFSHCATDDHVLNLLSAQFYLLFFDEVSTFEWDMFTKLSSSCRVPTNSGLIASVRAATNPLGVSADEINRHWVAKDIEPEEEPTYNPAHWRAIRTDLKDNPHLDAEQYTVQLGPLAGHVKKAWVEGEFSLENALFDFIPRKDGKAYHVTDYLDLEGIVKNAQIYRVYDAGWYPDPSYCAWIAHLGHRFIVFHEKIWYKTVVSDIAEEIKLEDEKLKIKSVAITFCDPTIDIKTVADVRTIKDMFEEHGIAMECSINNREHFASMIHSALAEEAEPGVPRLQIYVNGKQGAPYLAKTLPQMRYDPKHPLRLADHSQDHATVAVAYFLISSGAMEHKQLFTPAKLKKWLQPKESKWILGNESVRRPVNSNLLDKY